MQNNYMKQFNKYVSNLLDVMQAKKDNTKDPLKIKILNRIIAILEEYI